MYDYILEKMVKAIVIVKLLNHVWMDVRCNYVDDCDVHGCKVTHDFIIPKMCIFANEVGGNTSQKTMDW